VIATVANREKGEVALIVEGQEYTLVLNTPAMVAAEEFYSTPTREATWDEFWSKVMRGSVKAITVLLWAMLRKYHAEITYDEAVDLMDRAGGLQGLTEIVQSANRASTPDAEDVKELVGTVNPRKAQGGRETARRRRGTGAGSTSAPAASA
jgi:hypothetical protein